MKKVLITGAAGYIGSHVLLAVREAGFSVVGIDDFSRGNSFVAEALGAKIHDCNIGDEEQVKQILKDEDIGSVIHMAAFAYVEESVRDPFLYFENNINKMIRFLSALDACAVRKIVFSSSCAIYGTPLSLPIRETEPKKPMSPYGATKNIGEQILNSLADAGKLSTVCLRYFNASGCDEQARIGECHEPEPHLIPRILSSIRHDSEFSVFGTDFPTADGTCVRDYIHVQDLASAHVKALQFLDSNPGFHAFNLGNARGFSIKEVIAVAEKVTGKKVKVRYADRRAGDPAELVGDFSLAREKLRWTPVKSDLEKIIGDAWRWHQKESS